jgi:hypothetical protein
MMGGYWLKAHVHSASLVNTRKAVSVAARQQRLLVDQALMEVCKAFSIVVPWGYGALLTSGIIDGYREAGGKV